MRTHYLSGKSLLAIFAATLLLAGCYKENNLDAPLPKTADEEITLRSSNFNFTASLKGDNEVPPVETNAVGNVIVKISKDETSIHYKLIVANIEDVTASHFHFAPEGQNGPVVAFLYSGAPSGPVNGVLAEGTITAANVIGPVFPGDLAALIDAIRDGNIYVNVHTVSNPPGKIRGQL